VLEGVQYVESTSVTFPIRALYSAPSQRIVMEGLFQQSFAVDFIPPKGAGGRKVPSRTNNGNTPSSDGVDRRDRNRCTGSPPALRSTLLRDPELGSRRRRSSSSGATTPSRSTKLVRMDFQTTKVVSSLTNSSESWPTISNPVKNSTSRPRGTRSVGSGSGEAIRGSRRRGPLRGPQHPQNDRGVAENQSPREMRRSCFRGLND